MSELYEIDPDGDLLIILTLTDEPFAPWDDHDADLTVSFDSLNINSTAETDSAQTTTGDAGPSTTDESPHSKRFKVSSKHLTLASRRFKAMLSGDWKEAKTVHEDGFRHVNLDFGFDPDALTLLLDIIHGKTKKVPRILGLEMLAKVAVLVDDFECHEEVALFVDIWIGNLSVSPPNAYNRDLVLWILISSVLRMPSQFKSASCTAILFAMEPIRTLGLPIRDIVVTKIDEMRQDLLNLLVGTLHDVLDKLRGSEERCGFECDSMLLGAIIQQLYAHHLIWPKPSAPFIGFSFVKSAQLIRSLRSPTWCDTVTRAHPVPRVHHSHQHECTLHDLLVPQIDDLNRSVRGLDLENLKLQVP